MVNYGKFQSYSQMLMVICLKVKTWCTLVLALIDSIEKVVIRWTDGSEIVCYMTLAINTEHLINSSNFMNKVQASQVVQDVLFNEIIESLKLSEVTHEENQYDDYSRELLLPHKMSQFGPSIGVGDIKWR